MWNDSGSYRVAQLNGNLVVEFRHYVSGDPFLSFIGATEPTKTSLTLLEAARCDADVSNELRLVSQYVVEPLAGDPRFLFDLDPDERDYLYSPREFASLEGRAHRKVRNRLNQFEQASATAGGIDIVEAPPEFLGTRRRSITALLDRWSQGATDGVQESDNERMAIMRLCESVGHLKELTELYFHVAIQGDDIYGFVVNEMLGDNTLAMHFCKSDGRISGLSTRLFVETMKFANDLGVKMVNLEQDLGIPGLRTYKEQLNPNGYLHKYRVALADD